MNNSIEILRLKKLAGLLSESEIRELGLKDLGIGAAMTVASLFGSPQQTKAQEPQQIVQPASSSTKEAKEIAKKIAKEIKSQGYKPIVGSLPIDDAIEELQKIVGGGIKIVQGRAVGQTKTAATRAAIEDAKSKASGQIVTTTNISFYKELENKTVEVIVFLGSK